MRSQVIFAAFLAGAAVPARADPPAPNSLKQIVAETAFYEENTLCPVAVNDQRIFEIAMLQAQQESSRTASINETVESIVGRMPSNEPQSSVYEGNAVSTECLTVIRRYGAKGVWLPAAIEVTVPVRAPMPCFDPRNAGADFFGFHPVRLR